MTVDIVLAIFKILYQVKLESGFLFTAQNSYPTSQFGYFLTLKRHTLARKIRKKLKCAKCVTIWSS